MAVKIRVLVGGQLPWREAGDGVVVLSRFLVYIVGALPEVGVLDHPLERAIIVCDRIEGRRLGVRPGRWCGKGCMGSSPTG